MTVWGGCDTCGEPVPVAVKQRRPRRFCSNACRQKNHRDAKRILAAVGDVDPIPLELRERPRWIRHKNKRPMALGGWWSSVKDETTWVSYAEARDARVGDGFGFVLNGDGVTCIDLDDCVEAGEPNIFAKTFVSSLAAVTGPTYVEFSPSGRGLHIWGFSQLEKGRVLVAGSLKVEVYPAGRFITVTGRPYVRAGLNRLDMTTALRLT